MYSVLFFYYYLFRSIVVGKWFATVYSLLLPCQKHWKILKIRRWTHTHNFRCVFFRLLLYCCGYCLLLLFFLLSSLLSTFAYRQWACFMLAWIAANWLNTRPRVYDMCVLCAFRYYCAVRCVPLLYAMFYLQSTLCTHTKPYTNDYYLSVEREYFNIIC